MHKCKFTTIFTSFYFTSHAAHKHCTEHRWKISKNVHTKDATRPKNKYSEKRWIMNVSGRREAGMNFIFIKVQKTHTNKNKTKTRPNWHRLCSFLHDAIMIMAHKLSLVYVFLTVHCTYCTINYRLLFETGFYCCVLGHLWEKFTLYFLFGTLNSSYRWQNVSAYAIRIFLGNSTMEESKKSYQTS